ncbi:MAG: hypothetical protein N4A70_08515 [Pelagimonas sp.]|jgi:hypothetical protein|nr:hypothetical protein [Pelagimonas sp.]
MSAEDILDSAIRNNRIAVAKTVLQTDEPLSQRLFWLSIIPNEIQFEVANHKFWRDHDEFCDFLHVDHILYGVLPTELENIEFMVNYCPQEGKELLNYINELLKQAAQVEIYNEPAEEMLRNARNDCNAFFLSSVFRRSVEQSLISYYQSNGQRFSDPKEYILPNNLSGRIRYSGSSKWNPGVKSLRGSVSVGVIAVRGGKLINGTNRKAGSWSLEKRIVSNIEWAAQESCSRMEFIKK